MTKAIAALIVVAAAAVIVIAIVTAAVKHARRVRELARKARKWDESAPVRMRDVQDVIRDLDRGSPR